MPAQTTKKGHIFFPDGCLVEIGDAIGSLFDLGAINSACVGTVNWTPNQVETANAGKLDKQIKDMIIDLGFTLINLDPEGIEHLGGGVLTRTVVAGSPVANPEDQVVAVGWVDRTIEDLLPTDSDGIILRPASGTIGITSVTGSIAGVLAADDDYFIVNDPNSITGEGIMFDTAGTASLVTTETVTIVFSSITPIATTVLNMGTSTFTLTPKIVRFRHTDSAGLERTLTIWASDINSGGFVFSFKGANEEGVEEMPISMTGVIDTDRTDGEQLLQWSIDSGAA